MRSMFVVKTVKSSPLRRNCIIASAKSPGQVNTNRRNVCSRGETPFFPALPDQRLIPYMNHHDHIQAERPVGLASVTIARDIDPAAWLMLKNKRHTSIDRGKSGVSRHVNKSTFQPFSIPRMNIIATPGCEVERSNRTIEQPLRWKVPWIEIRCAEVGINDSLCLHRPRI